VAGGMWRRTLLFNFFLWGGGGWGFGLAMGGLVSELGVESLFIWVGVCGRSGGSWVEISVGFLIREDGRVVMALRLGSASVVGFPARVRTSVLSDNQFFSCSLLFSLVWQTRCRLLSSSFCFFLFRAVG
jgi:hypothetical protein